MTAPRPAREKPRAARTALAALAGAAAACAPLAAAAEPHGGHGHGGHMGGGHGGPHGVYEGGPHGGGYERGPRGGGGYERGPGAYGAGRGGWGRGEPEGEESWNDRRYNGFWLNNRWHYGPPPGAAYRDPGFRPGFAPWRRGAYLPPSYQGYVVDEYWRFHLRRPPYGYHWVQVGDDYLLVSVSTGVIFDIVSGD